MSGYRPKACAQCNAMFRPAQSSITFCSRACYFTHIHSSEHQQARFWSSVQKTGDSDDWLWTKRRNKSNYGVVAWEHEMRLAHRVSWEITYGHIPPGMGVLHHCDNPPCVRPDHLHLGDHAQNMREMYARGRKTHFHAPPPPQRGEQNPSARLTASQVLELRDLRATEGLSYAELGRRFGIGAEHAGRIVRGLKWRHLLPDGQVSTR
jgi:hypothetical protein